MSSQEPATSNPISSTTLQRNIGQIMRRVHNQGEHIVVERDGFPMMVILPIADYDKLKKGL